jgi:small GTP-binding protein
MGHSNLLFRQAGQESFRTITRAYYKNAIGIILVYDLNEPHTLETIDSWLKEISDNSNEIVEIVLVGNKLDLVKPPARSPKPQFPFITTSAKTGANISELFSGLSQRVLDKIRTGKINADEVRVLKYRHLA